MSKSPRQRQVTGRVRLVSGPAGSVNAASRSTSSLVRGGVVRLLKFIHPVLFLLIAVLVLPFVYAYVFLGVLDLGDLENRHLMFIALCTASNFLCGLAALYSSGRLSRRIESAFLITLSVHCSIVLLIVIFRLYYSRPLMLSAFLASFFLAMTIVLIMEHVRPRRIGIVPHKFNPQLLAWVGSGIQVIPSSDISPRVYDVVLVSFEEPMDLAWTRFVADALLSGCDVRHIAEVIEDMHGRVSPEHFRLEHASVNPDVSGYLRIKRLVDIVVVTLLAPLVLLILAVTWVQLKRSMGGNFLFVQKRVGLGGRTFKIYKLRTMRDKLPEEEIRATIVDDPRITPLGRKLRRYRIDELPQMWNVFKGDMSLIGPRPEQLPLCDKYALSLPAFEYRHLLRPGITGWAQVCAGYAANDEETREKLSYDLYYAKYVSPGLDLKIVIKTLFVLGGSQQVR